MKLFALLPSISLTDSCPPIDLTIGRIIGKTVDVPFIGQYYQYLGIPYAEPPDRWRPSLQSRKIQNPDQTIINNLSPQNSCPEIGNESVLESCLYFDIYKPIGTSY
jgi:carboxylesterase type B